MNGAAEKKVRRQYLTTERATRSNLRARAINATRGGLPLSRSRK